jgi:hypothetical protein
VTGRKGRNRRLVALDPEEVGDAVLGPVQIALAEMREDRFGLGSLRSPHSLEEVPHLMDRLGPLVLVDGGERQPQVELVEREIRLGTPVGLVVQPARWRRRLPSSMKKST